MAFKTLNVPTTTISDVKKSPTAIFHQAEKEHTPVYVFNRGDVAGVMLTREQYEEMVEENDKLHEQILNLIVAQRLMKTDVKTYTDAEVRGQAALDTVMEIDENDGWE